MRLGVWVARSILRLSCACLVWVPAEPAHRLLVLMCTLPGVSSVIRGFFRLCRGRLVVRPRAIGSLQMVNHVGIAGGFDKNGQLVKAFDALGFGFFEVGTVTPKPQVGNPKPRIQKDHRGLAIVNAMGFNNDGVGVLKRNMENLSAPLKQRVIVSVSKNKTSTDWVGDLRICMQTIWSDCGAIAVNVSSPNTPDLRNLQTERELRRISDLYVQMMQEMGPSHLLASQKTCYPVLACKLSPDLSDPELRKCLETLLDTSFGAVVLTNTTIDRRGVASSIAGGVSGAPLRKRADQVLQRASQFLRGRLPIIGVGGITAPEHASEKLRLGASAVQVYTGLVFKGPQLLWDILESQTI